MYRRNSNQILLIHTKQKINTNLLCAAVRCTKKTSTTNLKVSKWTIFKERQKPTMATKTREKLQEKCSSHLISTAKPSPQEIKRRKIELVASEKHKQTSSIFLQLKSNPTDKWFFVKNQQQLSSKSLEFRWNVINLNLIRSDALSLFL